jgi:hypothetical protein
MVAAEACARVLSICGAATTNNEHILQVRSSFQRMVSRTYWNVLLSLSRDTSRVIRLAALVAT